MPITILACIIGKRSKVDKFGEFSLRLMGGNQQYQYIYSIDDEFSVEGVNSEVSWKHNKV